MGLLAYEPAGRADLTGRPAVFLDRDGVLNELVRDPASGVAESPYAVEDVRLIPGAAMAMRELARMGFALVCVSNQPAAAKETVTVQRLQAVHERIVELLELEGARLDASRLCLHHPDGSDPTLGGPCACRKPAPGMLLDAAGVLHLELAGSWMVGDTDADVGAGQGAGCATFLIEHPGSASKRSGRIRPDLLGGDMVDALSQIAATPRS